MRGKRKISRLDKIRNERFGTMKNVLHTIFDETETKQSTWFRCLHTKIQKEKKRTKDYQK